MLPLCAEERIGVIPWSPLARGLLTKPLDAKTVRSESDPFATMLYTMDVDRQIAARTQELAAKRGVPPAQVALAWVLSKSVITSPIIGASKPHHLDDAVASLSVKLSEEEGQFLEELYVPHPVKDHS